MPSRKMADSKRSFSVDDKSPVGEKRKYRKHPKPDSNAPKKPSPSAYHLFALEQGDKLRKKGYVFEDIARETGALWRSLSPQAVNELEAKTTNAKNQYRKDLSAYKKSANYKIYQEYLKRWMAKEEAKKKQTSIHAINEAVSSPHESPKPSISSSSPPLPSTEELPALDWTSSSSPLSNYVPSSASSSDPDSLFSMLPVPDDWFSMPRLSTSEQMEWKWSADCAVTLAPDPLFPIQPQQQQQPNPRGLNMFDDIGSMPLGLTVSPSMLTESTSWASTPGYSYAFA